MPDKVLQPALIIGLGGSGTDVVRRFKRRFRETETPYIQVLGIDTAPQETTLQDRPPLADDEFVYTSGFNTEFFVGDAYIDQHPEIREWWKGFNLTHKLIAAGAGQRRPFGRLALYVHYEAVVQRVRKHLQRIFNNEVFSNLPPQYRGAMNVYIVASTCGGTGTGMFLDVAYLLPQLVQQVMPGTKHVWVRGILLLPSVFLDTQQVTVDNGKGLRTNAWGALTELDACMYRGTTLGPLRFPGNVSVPRTGAPFHSCFLLGSQTAEGAVVTNFNELLERAAVHIQIELASEITDTGKARLDNPLEHIRAQPDSQGRPRLYSSFSNEWLELPSSRVMSRWTRHCAAILLRQLMGESASVDKGLLDHRDAYGKLRSLVQGKGLTAYLPRTDPFIDNLMDLGDEGQPASVLIERARALEAEAQRQLAATGLFDLARDHATRLATEVRETATELLRGGSSLVTLEGFLQAVVDELNQWLSKARQQSGGAAQGAWLDAFQRHAQEQKKGALQKTDTFVKHQRQLVIDAVQRAKEEWHLAIRGRMALELENVLPGVIPRITALRDHTVARRSLLDAAMTVVNKQRDPVVPAGAAFTVSDDQIDSAFEDAARQEQIKQLSARRIAELLESGPTDSENLAAWAYVVSNDIIRHVAGPYLSTLDIPASEIARQLSKMSPLAAFKADWHTRADSKDQYPLWLVGLPEASKDKQSLVRESLDVGLRDKVEFILHSDEGRVIMTAQNHGFPLYALAELEACAHDYEQVDPLRKRLCFVYPDKELQSWQIRPASNTQTKEAFAIALALGWIKRVGTDYVCTLEGADYTLGGEDDPRVARSRARDAFLTSGLERTVTKNLNARLQRDGNGAVHADLKRWVADQDSRMASNPDFPSEFTADVRSVREYMTRIEDF